MSTNMKIFMCRQREADMDRGGKVETEGKVVADKGHSCSLSVQVSAP